MAHDMEQKSMDEGRLFPEVLDLLGKSRKVAPPADFTTRVMAALPDRPGGLRAGLAALLCDSREFTFNPARALRDGADREESFFYFVVLGFAHLIVSLFLASGLRGVVLPPAPYSQWISLQPAILLFCTLWFFAAALLVLVPGRWSRKAAQLGALGYVEIMTLDLVTGVLVLGRSPLLLPVLWFSSLGIISGLFLLKAIGRQGDGLPEEGTAR